jgi:glucokinase
MSKCLLGFDIGGTKCAVILGQSEGGQIRIIEREAFPTPLGPESTLLKFEATARELLADRGWQPEAIGISCGSPLDSRRGVVLGPPNLPGWDNVPITKRLSTAFGIPTHLQNDANACALAEWRWGAGRGAKSLVFLTFGTGMGAGLVFDGRLYSGACDLAGEVGHIRLAEHGPEGYGKHGSFEGFCSGGGIVRLAREYGFEAANARQVFEAASAKNPVAVQVIETAARYLGRGLAVLVDVLNPELIVVGSIFARQRDQLWPIAEQTLRAEALPAGVSACRVVPAALGEQIGDYAALSVATLAT